MIIDREEYLLLRDLSKQSRDIDYIIEQGKKDQFDDLEKLRLVEIVEYGDEISPAEARSLGKATLRVSAAQRKLWAPTAKGKTAIRSYRRQRRSHLLTELLFLLFGAILGAVVGYYFPHLPDVFGVVKAVVLG